MKYDVEILEGTLLDAAVAAAAGFPYSLSGQPEQVFVDGVLFRPSTDWAQGGPIIERNRIMVAPRREAWIGFSAMWEADGPTPLIAAMRAFVAGRFELMVGTPTDRLN